MKYAGIACYRRNKTQDLEEFPDIERQVNQFEKKKKEMWGRGGEWDNPTNSLFPIFQQSNCAYAQR